MVSLERQEGRERKGLEKVVAGICQSLVQCVNPIDPVTVTSVRPSASSPGCCWRVSGAPRRLPLSETSVPAWPVEPPWPTVALVASASWTPCSGPHSLL